jgi:signal transduction histidine kinase
MADQEGSAEPMIDAQAPGDETVSSAALGVLDVAGSLLGDLDLERVLDRLVESAQELTDARYAALGVLDQSRMGLARFITSGIDESTRHRIGSLPTGRGVLGELIRHPVPLRIDDVGAHPRSYGFPAGHPPMGSFLGVPVMVGGEPFGNLYLTEKHGGGQFTSADEQAVVRLAQFAGVAIDHARRYGSLQSRRDELQRTVDALGAMVEISRAIGGETDLGRILELVAKRGRALVSARALIIELQDDGRLEVAAAAGRLPEGLVGRQIALDGSVADAALRTGRTQRLEDQLNRARFNERGLGRLGFEADGGLVVPMVFRGRSVGVLVALDRLQEGPHFSVQDERLLESFAISAATAVATAQSVAAERRGQRLAAAEQERGRWARELHDETLQGLAALRLGLAAAHRAGTRDALQEAVIAAIQRLEGDISGLRALISELRPPALDQLGVKAAIQALTERVAHNGLSVDVHIDLAHEEGRADTRHTPELEITMYRIVQESLTNAVKNGHATRSVVELVEASTVIELTIRDDGAGFDPTERTEGFGVLGMRERAELIGGTLGIESAPGQGTTVRATLPVRRRPLAEIPLELEAQARKRDAHRSPSIPQHSPLGARRPASPPGITVTIGNRGLIVSVPAGRS